MNRNGASLTRRRATKLLGAAALGAVPTARLVAPAAAGRGWCRVDPHILVGPKDGDFDREMHIYIHSTEEMLDPAVGANGPVKLSVEIPPQHKAKLLDMDSGFLGYSYQLDFQTNAQLKDSSGAIDVVVKAVAPAHTRLEVHVELVPITSEKSPSIGKGYSNRTITVKGKL